VQAICPHRACYFNRSRVWGGSDVPGHYGRRPPRPLDGKNCLAGTIRADDFQESDLGSGLTSLKRPIGPPIWKYAGQAGYRTIMINGLGGEKTSIALELPAVEYFPEISDPPYMRDGLIAERLLQLLKEDVPSFIYVNKFGTHVPYEADFPPTTINLVCHKKASRAPLR
jgi:hypothetical protein